MPGLSQIKQFNKDLLALGDELTVRAGRGEKPVTVPIPKDIADVNDSEDFVLGMPENEAAPEITSVDEDLSDLASLVNPTSSSSNKSEEQPAPSFEAPDMSSILSPVVPSADDGAMMPDLSMFEEPVDEEPEPEPEPEPEEISVADMGLDALLAGAGFDNSEGIAEEEPPAEEEDDISLPEETVEEAEPEPEPSTDDAFAAAVADIPGFDMPSDTPEQKSDGGFDPSVLNFDEPAPVETPADDITNFDESVISDEPDSLADTATDINNLDLPDFGEPAAGGEDLPDFGEPAAGLDDFADMGDALPGGDAMPDFGEPAAGGEELADFGEPAAGLDDLADMGDALPDGDAMPDFGEPAAGGEELADFGEPGAGLDDLADMGDALPDGDAMPDFGEPAAGGEELADFGEPAAGLDDLADMGDALPDGDAMPDFGEPAAGGEELADFGEPAAGLDDLADMGDALPEVDAMPDFGEPAAGGEELADFGESAAGLDDLADMGDALPDGDAMPDFGEPAAGGEDLPDFGESAPEELGIPDDFDSSDNLNTSVDFDEDLSGEVPAGLFEAGDMEMANAGGIEESLNDVTEEIPDFDDTDESLNSDDFDSGESIETFDAPEMDDMEFGVPDTDSQLGGSDQDFELGQGDEFAMEGDFEIPGFSDVDTSTEILPNQKTGKLDSPDFSNALPSNDLPPNTLSDEQYQQFLKNLHEYPLNVRLAFEDLIVQDEFTDDAEFEVIEKILNKAPARSVASMLEKMLDISLPVPRDYENRTAEEYEAYKKSLSYQLRNKIIPGILIGIIFILVGWGLFNFTKNCIYKPLKAIKLYKQGYTLLEADEYPQSEMKFNEATSYRLNKKWFFNYARGYREHKQYMRADKMYQNILYCFNHDKAAGLEYADMQLNDLASYERAEEIVRREILDYHINDAEGILKLGDVFLEWGTEKDPSKLELARQQYATLIQLYGSTDLYMSRMLRYFIRSDNLRQVLQTKQQFDGKGKEKSLSADDWTELSGYLLQKTYGELPPAEEYLRYQIEGLRKCLLTAVKANPANPVAHYNLALYNIKTNELSAIEPTLKDAIEMFNQAKSMKRRDIYKYIDSYRLLGEHYIETTDYLQAQEQYAEGIKLYTTERDNAGFTGNKDIGKLYADLADLNYFVSGDYDSALMNYKYSVELENDSPSIRYRIGYIQYCNKNYVEALGSFMKAGDGNIKERNLMLAMANTLYMRGDDYAAEGYYEQLIKSLDEEIAEKGLVLPQANLKDYDIVNTYLAASNNYGVTLYHLAKRTGDSSKNGEAIVQFSQSVRAWDALTRNQETLKRLGGSNLAQQNIQYITHPIPDYEPTVYTEIQKTLTDKEKL